MTIEEKLQRCRYIRDEASKAVHQLVEQKEKEAEQTIDAIYEIMQNWKEEEKPAPTTKVDQKTNLEGQQGSQGPPQATLPHSPDLR